MTIQTTNQRENRLGWFAGTGLWGSAAQQEREARVRKLLPEDEEETAGSSYDSRLTGRLIRYLKPYRTQTLWAIVLMSISSLLHVAGPWLIGKAIDEAHLVEAMTNATAASLANALWQLRWWSLAFIITALLEWGTNLGRIQLMAYAGTKVVADMRSELFRHLQLPRWALDEPVDQRCGHLARLCHLVDHRAGAVGLYPDWRYHCHAATQLAISARYLCPHPVHALAHRVLAATGAHGLSRHPDSPLVDQRLSQRVDLWHPRHSELYPGSAQLPPL
jgi:hypothetical protein